MQVWPQVTKTNSDHLDASRYLKDAIRVTFQNWNALWGFLPLVAHLTCTHFCMSACAEELDIRLVHALSCDVRGKKKEKENFGLSAQKRNLKKCLLQITTGGGGCLWCYCWEIRCPSLLNRYLPLLPLFTSAQDVLSSSLDLTFRNLLFACISVSCTAAYT